MKRRQFIAAVGSAAACFATGSVSPGKEPPEPSASRLPRWRGFNLLEKFTARHNAPFVETDFAQIAEFGFDFVRLPLSYHCWSDPGNWRKLDEKALKEIDQAVQFGQRHAIHVSINFHRAPGYCVNPPKEPLDLWSDAEALKASCHHWSHFARRYRGIPNARLSFDLLNEPAKIPEETYVRVAKELIGAIRREDPQRLIIADGLRWGRDPVHGLADSGVAQSTRGYDPMRISHHRASWIGGSDRWPAPAWPLKLGDWDVYDKDRLRRENIVPWKALEKKGVGVHVGEWGAYRATPHHVALAWMQDFLELWKEAGWGWALWNFRGSFGILDSGREDVKYEDFRGHKLDRKMLTLLQAY